MEREGVSVDLTYTFEPMSNGMYQVRLCGEFVCYSAHKDEEKIDEFLEEEGYGSREEYLELCHEEIDELV